MNITIEVFIRKDGQAHRYSFVSEKVSIETPPDQKFIWPSTEHKFIWPNTEAIAEEDCIYIWQAFSFDSVEEEKEAIERGIIGITKATA